MMARGELERQVIVLLWRADEPLTVADVNCLFVPTLFNSSFDKSVKTRNMYQTLQH